ncbi:uncharacterized protein CTRU02_205699 [Colletotrichum truncatum]|uniref:Uncharacterized protein n=1 Tax=Colletotrichum truncatum TaxID=5467 RepID=A0ACC3Z4S5_COLTU
MKSRHPVARHISTTSTASRKFTAHRRNPLRLRYRGPQMDPDDQDPVPRQSDLSRTARPMCMSHIVAERGRRVADSRVTQMNFLWEIQASTDLTTVKA